MLKGFVLAESTMERIKSTIQYRRTQDEESVRDSKKERNANTLDTVGTARATAGLWMDTESESRGDGPPRQRNLSE
jgi:hypothetical protein